MKAAVVLAVLLSPGLFAADTILIHGHVYTGLPGAPWAEALSVTGTRIDAVGADTEIARRKTAQTKVVDLQGRTVIPGIVDIHEHMLYGGMAIQGFNFSTPEFNITPDDSDIFVASLKVQAGNHPNEQVLYGRVGFPLTANSSAKLELLDRAVPGRYLVIHATHEHALWVNSKVLALAGITARPLADPFLEQFIVRDASGRPTGVVRESAMQIVNKSLPPMSLEQRMSILRDAAHYLNSYGITSVAELTGDMDELEALAKLRDRGQLTVRVRVGFAKVAVNHKATPEFFAELEKARSLYRDDFVSANLVKFFADGLGNPLFYDPRDYSALIDELDKRGFQIVTHALTAQGAHAVLEGYEQMEKTDPARDRRPRVEHASSLDAADLARFAKLSTVAGMQPAFCCRNQSYQMGSMQKSGAVLTLSSDWPCSWPPDPLAGIQQAMLREQRRGVTLRSPEQGEPVYNLPEERITLEQAVAGYTRNAAWANFTENKVGTLEPGKEADLAVLSRDIFSARPEDIGKTQVVMTMTGGKVVFER